MDYYQGVVVDYLSADPAMFIKPECCIRLNPEGRLKAGEHWYCDILAVSFRESAVYLCEVTLSRNIAALYKRLGEWNANWTAVCAAVARDNQIRKPWSVRPWVFVPDAQRKLVSRRVSSLLEPAAGPHQMPRPLATSLEAVAPWRYSLPLELPGEREADA